MPAQADPILAATPVEPDAGGIVGVLIKEGKVTSEQREKAKLAFVATGVRELDYLVQQRMVSLDDIVGAKAKFYNVPLVKLTEKAISPVALAYVDKATASRLQLVPFEFNPVTRELSVAMANPVDLGAIEFLEKKLGVRVKVFAANPAEVRAAVETRDVPNLS